MSDQAPRILLGITGGIAAYKAAEVASRLTQEGKQVRVVMSQAARSFIGPLTLAALTGHPVAGDMFDPGQEAAIGHIELARWAQVVVVAPATAHFLARAALGLADDLLTTLLLATRARLVLAPAMNPHMFAHPTVAENLRVLEERGAWIVGPARGRTACGEEGPGRMVEALEIVRAVNQALAPRDLEDVPVLVTAGPTREHLDPVRFISNPSTGRMGIEAARAAAQRGARVTLVLGPTHLEPPRGVRVIRVVSAQDMYQAVMSEAAGAKVIVKAAAVSDFKPAECAPHKVKKSGNQEDNCRLVSTPDILARLGRDKGGRILVGFAAETQDLLANARAKLEKKNLDLLVANDVSAPDSGFAVGTNRVTILSPRGEPETLPLLSKPEVAHRLWDRVAALLHQE